MAAALSRGTPIRQALDGAITAIAAGGCDSPRLDAELLLAHALGLARERLLIDSELEVSGPAVRVFQQLVRRRAIEREPLAYIVRVKHFRHVQLKVDRRALIPRPETELLVELALSLPSAARVLDLGTGSGAIALALKHERPDLWMSASDANPAALELARENGARLGLEVDWREADLLAGLDGEFDAVLSNPPYVPDAARAKLAPEIVRHEPADALFAGSDGLETIRPLIWQVVACERVRLLAVEVGAGQAGRVAELMHAAGFTSARSEPDLAGIERVVVGER